MIRANQIPDEVVEAARAAYRDGFEQLDSHEEIMRASIAAALSAWPGVVLYPPDVLDDTINPTRIILPLPQEARDE